MRTYRIQKTIAVALLAALLIVATGKAAAESSGNKLTLATSPLFGLNVTPNVLFVMDDSTTMDLEVLFKGTRDGVLYWKPCLLALTCTDNGTRPTWQNGHFVDGIGPQYAFGYLFPNGINSWHRPDNSNASDDKGLRVSAMYKAIPPLPYMGFARSPSYNKLYFNPNINYQHWPELAPADPEHADAAPDVDDKRTVLAARQYPIDKTQNISSGDSGSEVDCGILQFLCDAIDSVTDALSGLGDALGSLLTGNSGSNRETKKREIAFDLTQTRGQFMSGELFTYGDWMGPIPDDRDFIGCTTGSLLLRLYHNERILSTTLGTDTVEAVFGILFGLTTNAAGILKQRLLYGLQQFLGDPLSAIGNIGELLNGSLEVVLLLLNGTVNSVGGLLSSGSLYGFTGDVLHEVIGAVIGLLDVLKIPAPCLNFHWTDNADGEPGALLNLGDTVEQLKNSVVGKITGYTGRIALQYYPATFYLYKTPNPGEISVPDNYGYSVPENERTTVSAPDGRTLIRYQIKASNFKNGIKYTTDDGMNITYYKAARQNFSNWFTYYRKRHLAVRGAFMQALDEFSGIRVGVTTTSQRDNFEMYTLSSDNPDGDDYSSRAELYEAIRDLDFSTRAGTPNRQSLQFAGEQLTSSGNNNPSCQPNNAILVTDGFNSAGVQGIGDADGDNVDNTIADVAMHYYENKPHMTTYAMSLGQNGTIFKNPSHSDWWSKWGGEQDPAYAKVDWPNVNAPTATDDSADNLYEAVDNLLGGVNTLLQVLLGKADASGLKTTIMGPEQIDDLWHATINSHGDMYLAYTPQRMIAEFKDMLRDIRSSAGSGSAASLAASEARIFQPVFDSSGWTGDLIAYESSKSGVGAAEWRAGQELDARNLQNSPRQIITLCNSNPVDFGNLANACTLSLHDYLNNTNGLTKLVAYVQGDSGVTINGHTNRNRNSLLGDIVHSDPVFVGDPERSRYPSEWDDELQDNETAPESKYSTFATNHAQRTAVVYVGANDGMLHAFNANNGKEIFAYIPSVFLSDNNDKNAMIELAELSKPTYVHQPYVDGSPIAGDAYFNSQWHTVLVGGLRRGGKAVYALDITNPKNFTKTDVLWELSADDLDGTAAQDAVDVEIGDNLDLGYTYGQPEIVRLHNGNWAAVFGNGYNSDSGAGLIIREFGTDKIITIKAAGSVNGEENGLSAVTPVDVDGDFIVDYIYAGDLQGNLWKFDLTAQNRSGWEVAFGGQPLFRASDDAGNTQPITSAPVVGRHPYGSSYGVMVYFGTGQLLETDDGSPSYTNSFYGIWDPNATPNTTARDLSTSNKPVESRNQLEVQTIITKEHRNGSTYRVLSDHRVKYISHDITADDTTDDPDNKEADRGWYIDLEQNEMIINTPYLQGNVVGFTTAMPVSNACATGGNGYIMRVAAINGGRLSRSVFDTDGDRDLDKADKFSVNVTTTQGQNVNKPVAASGVQSETGRPSEATFVPGAERVVYNTTSGTIQASPTPDLEGVRRTWRVIRP